MLKWDTYLNKRRSIIVFLEERLLERFRGYALLRDTTRQSCECRKPLHLCGRERSYNACVVMHDVLTQ